MKNQNLLSEEKIVRALKEGSPVEAETILKSFIMIQRVNDVVTGGRQHYYLKLYDNSSDGTYQLANAQVARQVADNIIKSDIQIFDGGANSEKSEFIGFYSGD